MAALLALTGCPQKVKVSIPPGSTTGTLRFLIGSGITNAATELPMFVVRSCSAAFSRQQNDYWRIEATPQPTALHELQYGVTPAGYVTTAPPKNLDPNQCYAASYAGAEEFYFSADSVGGVTTLSREEARRRAGP